LVASMSSSRSPVRLKARSIVPGVSRGRIVVFPHAVSFYGELERLDLSGAILIAKGSRGSTVAPYIIYRMRRESRAPEAIILIRMAEPMVIAGAVLARIPLCDRLEVGDISVLESMEGRTAIVTSLRENRTCIIEVCC